ncbi:MAG: YdcF family protein [Eubacteriales bacterium]|jgi:uncharacterized SAM-binding protein YcdF (DUF218 family)
MRIIKYIKNKWQAWRSGELGEDRSTLRETRGIFGAGAERRAFRLASVVIPLVLAVFCLVYWVICLIAAGGAIDMLWIWPAAVLFFGLCSLFTAGRRPFVRLRRVMWLRITIAAMIAALICAFIVVECLVISGMNETGEPGLDYIIVLGAQVRGTTPSFALYWRIERAYEYLSENPNTVAVVAGGQGSGEDISEAECMRRELTRRGIAEERIIIEDKSTSTKENISFSLEKIDKTAKIGVVTNNFHVWRATRIARRAGAENAVGIAAPYRNVLIIHYMAREFFSVVANSLSGNM